MFNQLLDQDNIAVQRYLESYTGKFRMLITEDIEADSLNSKDDNNIIIYESHKNKE